MWAAKGNLMEAIEEPEQQAAWDFVNVLVSTPEVICDNWNNYILSKEA